LKLGRSPKSLNLHDVFDLESAKTTLFVFFLEDTNTFFSCFPRFGRPDARVVEGSCGEMDSVFSMTMQQMVDLQEATLSTCNNNYFAGYFLKSFAEYAVPTVKSRTFQQKWSGYRFRTVEDKEPFYPDNLTVFEQVTRGSGKQKSRYQAVTSSV